MFKYIALLTLILHTSVFSAEPPVVGWIPPKKQDIEQVLAHTTKARISFNNLVEICKDDKDSSAYTYRPLIKGKKVHSGGGGGVENDVLVPYNQKNLGSCVGHGTIHALEITYANDVYVRNKRVKWLYSMDPQAMYALSRYKHKGSWEGSTGAWSIDALKTLGSLHNKKYKNFDLSGNSINLARQWQSQGVPSELLEQARPFTGDGVLVSTVEEVRVALQNGYGAFFGAKASFSNKRDKDGFSRRTGTSWAHAMGVGAYRSEKETGREGYLVINSWGKNWISGPRFKDQPYGSFYITAEELKFLIDQKDFYIVTNYAGFEKTGIDWEQFIR